MTQREKLEMALARYGCAQVKVTAKGSQWTVGALARAERAGKQIFFFVGNNGGFRHGYSRSDSLSWPALRARLLAEPITATREGECLV